jgi:hypothetical protein
LPAPTAFVSAALRRPIPQVQQDTTSALADSINVSLDRIGENVTDTGRLILSGHFVERMREALAAADIEIPFPHLQLFLDGAEALRDTPIRVASD